MSNITARAGIKEATISAVITRADGTVEDLGVIARMRKESIFRRVIKWLMRVM